MSALKIAFDYCLNEKAKEDTTDTGMSYNYSKWNIKGLMMGKVHL